MLVVEDDPAIADLVRRSLAEAGIEVDVAETGSDGLWMAREGSYGAMCLDILLPELNGWEVCRQLREKNNLIPILMLTAKTGEYDETDGLDLGADDYLRKPFSPAVLVARVRALLRRSGTSMVPEELQRGRVSFDARSRACALDGTEVVLTKKEGAVLEALLRSGEVPLPRADLIDQVWGMEFDGDPNIVDVYLGYLRRKLGSETIETVRGIGFRVRQS